VKEAEAFIQNIGFLANLRLSDKTLFSPQHCSFIEYEEVLGFSYQHEGKRIEIVANLSTYHTSTVAPVEVVFSSQELDHVLRPMEVKVLRF
jgi:hypothetical protein